MLKDGRMVMRVMMEEEGWQNIRKEHQSFYCHALGRLSV